MKKYEVIVIGAGLGGIICALELKKAGIDVLLVEANDRIGKKILVSGNGKCNILNKNLSIDKYNSDFLKNTLSAYSIDKLEQYLNELGLLLRIDSEGREYPYSESANTVLNVLLNNLKKEGVEIITSCKVKSIIEKNPFKVQTTLGDFLADNIVLATGSNATFGINSHALFEPYGHKCKNLVQTLVSIKTSEIKGCSGVRSKVKADLYINNKKVYTNNGEMLFKDNCISGIISFQLSTFISRSIVKGEYINSYITIDFVPGMEEETLRGFINEHGDLGIVHKSILSLFKSSKDLAHDLKNYRVEVKGLQGINQAQVTAGGLNTDEFNSISFESNNQKGLYAIGEVLDVDGECGGYNLSAALAMGLACAQGIKEKYENKNI